MMFDSVLVALAPPRAAADDSGEAIALSPCEVVSDGSADCRFSTINVLTRANRATVGVPRSVDVLPEELLENIWSRMVGEALVCPPNARKRNTSGGSSRPARMRHMPPRHHLSALERLPIAI